MDDNQSSRGIPQYRCQRCGGITMNTEAPCISSDVIATFAQNPFAVEVSGVPRSCLHLCEDDGSGIATIIGLFPEKHVAGLKARLAAEREAEAKTKQQSSKSAN